MFVRWPLLAALLCLSCASKSQDTSAVDPCPRAGTVLADMRDVERDAEGVSYATFGAVPDHVPDYARASGVLSLLRQVWDRANTHCPALPADAVAKVETAIATLDVAIPAHDQTASAYAANDIHIQMAPLFDYFHPTTPLAVVRMDAVFLRVGVDAWYEDWTSFDTNLAALNADWSTLKAAATTKVPMCNRVAGTASVIDDIDQTLATLATASSTRDIALAQRESDAGLLEVDILELLFDCPAGTQAPTAGVGAACTSDGTCDSGLVCNREIESGRCAQDAATAHVGATCTTTVDCGTNGRSACNNEVGDGFPGGYCVMEPCDDVQVCPRGATCVAMPFETPACMQSCGDDSDCRVADGYVCQLFPTTPPSGFGPSDHACAFPCSSDDQCSSPLTCNVSSGKCVP